MTQRLTWPLLCGFLATAACSRDEARRDPTTFTWLEGFSYGWEFFNHRVSHLEAVVEDDGARVAVVGGTSTTSEVPDLADTCDPEACAEFPFFDTAQVALRWGRVTTDLAVAAVGSGELTLGPTRTSTRVEVEAPAEAPDGDPVVLLRGFRFSTDLPLTGGESCYNPRYGWLPTVLDFGVGEVVTTDAGVEVELTGQFAAGRTLEAERACLDEVIDQAQAALSLDVLVIWPEGSSKSWRVEQEATFPYGSRSEPIPQEPPALPDEDIPLAEAAAGVRALAWSFHREDPDLRGAYLRTWGFRAQEDGVAGGWATNYSPGTQLSAFDYTFAGEFAAVEVGEGVETGELTAGLRPTLAVDGAPEVSRFGLVDGPAEPQ